MDNDAPIEVRIMQVYGELSASEQRLASVILEMDGNFAGFTAGELAARAEVSNPTAARFFRRLGYDSYQQAHSHARLRAAAGSPLTALGKRADQRLGTFDFVPFAEHEAQNLQRMASQLDPIDIERAVRMLHSSQRILIVGYRAAMGVGLYLQAMLGLLREGVSFMSRSGMTLSEELVNLGEGDLVVLLAFRRRQQIMSRVLRAATRQGAHVLQFTDMAQSGRAETSVVTLRCAVEGLGIFDNYAGAMTLINCLMSLLEESIGRPAVAQRLGKIEQLLEEVDGLTTGN